MENTLWADIYDAFYATPDDFLTRDLSVEIYRTDRWIASFPWDVFASHGPALLKTICSRHEELYKHGMPEWRFPAGGGAIFRFSVRCCWFPPQE